MDQNKVRCVLVLFETKQRRLILIRPEIRENSRLGIRETMSPPFCHTYKLSLLRILQMFYGGTHQLGLIL